MCVGVTAVAMLCYWTFNGLIANCMNYRHCFVCFDDSEEISAISFRRNNVLRLRHIGQILVYILVYIIIFDGLPGWPTKDRMFIAYFGTALMRI